MGLWSHLTAWWSVSLRPGGSRPYFFSLKLSPWVLLLPLVNSAQSSLTCKLQIRTTTEWIKLIQEHQHQQNSRSYHWVCFTHFTSCLIVDQNFTDLLSPITAALVILYKVILYHVFNSYKGVCAYPCLGLTAQLNLHVLCSLQQQVNTWTSNQWTLQT